MYQIIIDGKKYGHYNPNCSPAQTAKKMAKKLYVMNDMKGTQILKIDFVLNRTIAQGNDKKYTYNITVYPTPDISIDRNEIVNYLKTNPTYLFTEANKNKELKKYLEKYVIKIKDKYILKKFFLEAEKL